MMYFKPQPVDSFENLRVRIQRLFKKNVNSVSSNDQMSLELSQLFPPTLSLPNPKMDIEEFLDFMSDLVPTGDLYLFGGLVRDVALLGRKGFNSDIDLVVDGEWSNCISYLEGLGAKRNKFGGFRLELAGWPVDIWNARETWAIREGFVEYRGVSSLLETTVSNWDAILMNWRTKNFICKEDYLVELNERMLDIVLEDNPNPLGMAVRVFRHFCMKDARKISTRAAEYLSDCVSEYSFDEIRNSELKSYGVSVIESDVYDFFKEIKNQPGQNFKERFNLAGSEDRAKGLFVAHKQTEWLFDEIVES